MSHGRASGASQGAGWGHPGQSTDRGLGRTGRHSPGYPPRLTRRTYRPTSPVGSNCTATPITGLTIPERSPGAVMRDDWAPSPRHPRRGTAGTSWHVRSGQMSKARHLVGPSAATSLRDLGAAAPYAAEGVEVRRAVVTVTERPRRRVGDAVVRVHVAHGRTRPDSGARGCMRGCKST